MITRSVPPVRPPFTPKLIRRLKILLTAGGLALQVIACGTASAVQLGGISLASSLNEPLQASISLKGLEAVVSPGSLMVSLASSDAHEVAGIPFDKAVTGLIFTTDLVSTPPVVRVETINPVTTPFLRFLVLLESAEQQLLRDYTLMLDPAEPATNVQLATTQFGQPRIPESRTELPGGVHRTC